MNTNIQIKNLPLTPEEFLGKKKDFSPFLIHLTKDEKIDDECILSAKDTLDTILEEKPLRHLITPAIFLKT